MQSSSNRTGVLNKEEEILRVCAQEKDHVEMQWEGGHLQAVVEVSEKPAAAIFVLDFSLGNVNKRIAIVQST